jgi:FtsP/CotA-like multicopper oxidase with cupredoxin domain
MAATPSAISRRSFLATMGAMAVLPDLAQQQPADITLRISAIELEIAPRRRIKTTAYNGAFPGPLLRLPENKPVVVDVINETGVAELVHWHGLFIPPEVDGAMEEGTPMVAPHSQRRYQFVPRPAGLRWYHSHIPAGRNLHLGTYTGQAGFLEITGAPELAPADQEVFLALHGWDAYLAPMAGGGGDSSLEAAYSAFTVNAHSLGSGEPIRVKEGQRVLFHLLNTNATLTHRLALAGHNLKILALDGFPVASPRETPILELAPGERAQALVEMNHPGVWILGETDDARRKAGLGIVLEYAARGGPPQWIAPPAGVVWDYTLFGGAASVPEPDERIPLTFRAKWAGNRWIDHWTINGKEYPKTDPILVRENGLYRLVFDNQSDDAHPVHLHRHAWELVKVAGKPCSGVTKDVVVAPPRKQVEVQFRANNPGASLFHCHMQLHMDHGFMTLLQYQG